MFDFVRKRDVWRLVDDGIFREIGATPNYELKTAQDVAVYGVIRDANGLSVAEVGGGTSRLLGGLATKNRCFNIDKFEGLGNGPTTAPRTPGVEVVPAYLGEFDPGLKPGSFDVVFSISVVEHIETPRLDLFHQDVLRILKPGGRFVHAIDMYLTDDVSDYTADRYSRYRAWVCDAAVEPLGRIRVEDARFECEMATNPDNILHAWGRSVPSLRGLRERAQSVSLLVGARKKTTRAG